MSAGEQIRGQWRVGTGGQVSRLLGWGVAAEGVQDGRKCRIPMAACLHGRKCQHSTVLVVFVAVHVPLYSFLCKQVWDGAHPCWDAFTGLCVYIKSSSNQIKSSVRNHEQSLYMYSSKLTSNAKMRNKAHGSVRRAPPLHPSFGGEEGSQIKLKSTQPSSTSSPVGGGERCYGGQPQGAVGVTEGWAPHGIRRWGSRRSLGTRSSSLRCTTCQQAQRLTGLNCLPLCVAVLGAPHVIYEHAAAAAPLAGHL